MKIAGITAEYNPFHLGHLRQIEETRSILGEDVDIVCVMSGNYVQRGEPAMFEKHARAEAAVSCGADLVLELPLPWAVATAEKFALGAVSVMSGLGTVEYFSFGSECGDVERLRETADVLLDERIDDLIKKGLSTGKTYAAVRNTAVEQLMGGPVPELKAPNDILGIEYIKAAVRLGTAMTPVAVKRMGAAHNGEAEYGIASAAEIRRLLSLGRGMEYLPEKANDIFERETALGRVSDFGRLEAAVLSRLRIMGAEGFEALPDISEGLHMRLLKASSAPTLEKLLEAAKTKRYSMSRIKRTVLCAYLGLTAEDGAGVPPYTRVLAMNAAGRRILRERTGGLQVITKPAEAGRLTGPAGVLAKKEAAATDLYVLSYESELQREGGSEWKKSPVLIEK